MAYTAQVVETDNVLKPFILDYIPSVGDIDAFIKVPRPDDVEDNLGLVVLDEPAAKQSDPTVLGKYLFAETQNFSLTSLFRYQNTKLYIYIKLQLIRLKFNPRCPLLTLHTAKA